MMERKINGVDYREATAADVGRRMMVQDWPGAGWWKRELFRVYEQYESPYLDTRGRFWRYAMVKKEEEAMSDILSVTGLMQAMWQNVSEGLEPLGGLQGWNGGAGWFDLCGNDWLTVPNLVQMANDGDIRLKPREHTIKVTVPAPVRHPGENQEVWLLDPAEHTPVSRERWSGSERQRMYLERGLLFASDEEARKAFRALFEGQSDD